MPRWFVIAACVVVGAAPLRAQCPDGSPPPCQARRAAQPPASVAVLYFDNLSRDTADAYLAYGLTDEIIARLRRIDRLTVKSRAAVERYRSSAADPAVLGRALGVTYLVNGSVRRSGTRLRVTVELVRAATGASVWGDQYDRTDADLLSTEEDIARAVTSAIAGRLLPQEQAALSGRATRNPEAYDHFLRGNYELGRRSPRAALLAIEEYEAAVRLDNGFARALARIGYAYGLFVDIGWTFPGLSNDSVISRAWSAVERSLRLDSSTSDAWMARGYILAQRYPTTFDGVRASFERAIALDPRNAEAFHQFGSVLRFMGDDSAAERANRRALALEPERAVTLLQLAGLAAVARRYDEAARLMDSSLTVDPGYQWGFAWRAFIRLLGGDIAGARADARTAIQLRPDDRLWGPAALAATEARAGDTAAVRILVDQLAMQVVDTMRPSPNEGWILGTALVSLGEYERALALIERVRPRGGMLWFRLRWPSFDPIRSSPRFQRVVDEARAPQGI